MVFFLFFEDEESLRGDGSALSAAVAAKPVRTAIDKMVRIILG